MIGNNGKVGGGIKPMLLKIGNGTRIERNYSEKTAMDGGTTYIKVITRI
jgi:hypothetical protein